MDEQEVSLTDEQWGKFDEIWHRFIKGPDNPRIVTFSGDGKEITEWLRNKFRALYDPIVFTGETHYGEDFGGEATIKDVDREIFAMALTRFASGFFIERMNASANAFLKGVVTEIHEYWPAFWEAAFKDNRVDSVKSKLPTKNKMTEIWQGIIQDHLDPKFVKDGRGGDRRSSKGLAEEDRRAIADRKAALMPFWEYLIAELKRNDYETDVWPWLRSRDRFKAECKERGITSLHVLDALIPDVLKRGAAPSPMPEHLMPASFALIHAARERGISGDYWALKKAVGKIKK